MSYALSGLGTKTTRGFILYHTVPFHRAASYANVLRPFRAMIENIILHHNHKHRVESYDYVLCPFRAMIDTSMLVNNFEIFLFADLEI